MGGATRRNILEYAVSPTSSEDIRADGGYIGVITAFCKGKTKCPEFVNKLKK